jgi:hypothetical protein
MAKLKLEIEADPEVTLIAISSHVNDYRLCWALNRRLGISLSRRARDIADAGAEATAQYAAFDHTDEGSQAVYTLINNHGTQGVLLKDQRQADYFLLVDDAAPVRPDELLAQVRDTEFVLTAFPLDVKRLRGAHKLFQ